MKLISLLLCTLLILSGCSFVPQPPAPERVEKTFQEYREEIQTVTDYLLTQKPPVDIYNSQELPENVSQAVRTLIRKAGCSSIHYSENAIHFLLWTRFTDAGCGIAYSEESSLCALKEDFPFLTQEQPLSEQNWFYYVEDYAQWRIEKNK